MKRWKPLRWLILFAGACVVVTSCDSGGGQTGSETHWFALCESDAACGGQLQCMCGMCTRTCAVQGCAAADECVSPTNSALQDSCEEQLPLASSDAEPGSAPTCAATCSASTHCPRGLECRSGICIPPARRAADASAPGTAPRDGGNADASSPSSKGGPKDAAADANYDWTMNCPNEMPPLGGSKLVDGPTVVMLSAPSGLYYGTPSAIGTGVIVRRLAPNGAHDLPLGDRWLPLSQAGPSGLFYSSSAGFQWYSPSEDRVIATWTNDSHLIPHFVGDSVEGVKKPPGTDGGGPFQIVTFEAAPDGGEPQTTPYSQSVADLMSEPGLITSDANTLYYSIANTIYAVTPGGQPQELATVDGLLWSLDLSADTLFVTVWGESNPPIHGGIVAVDRATGQQKRLVTADEIHETRVFGDNLYYATPNGTDACIDLRRVPAAGGVPVTLATSALFSFTFDASQMYAATFTGLYQLPP